MDERKKKKRRRRRRRRRRNEREREREQVKEGVQGKEGVAAEMSEDGSRNV